jgi:predicted MFS family arabinose efflux permease
LTTAPAPLAPHRERALLWLLACTQFALIMDFMVMMPLGPQIMSAFAISPAAFAAAVSAYSWCAGLSGLLGATYVDRFDRKRLLLTMFALFSLSNLACALAPNYELLLASRAFAGLTGGVMFSLILSVVGDVIPAARRGAATGIVMTAFSMAAVAGVPTGVVLGAHFGWQATFYVLVGLTVPIWIGIARMLPPLRGHLAERPPPLSRVVPDLFALIFKPAHLRAFLASGLVMAASMLVIPFISPVLVANHGVAPRDIAWIYGVGGLATLFTARWIGRLSDIHGRPRVFRWVALCSTAPLLFMTHMPDIPLAAIIAFFPTFIVLMSGRNIPLNALMTTVPPPAQRGAFLSVNAAVQSLGTGLGAWVGGLMLSSGPDGRILGYGYNGWAAVALTLFAVAWVSRVRPADPPKDARAELG